MPDKITLQPGEKLTITVKRKKSPSNQKRRRPQTAPSSGLIKTRRADDYLARRKKTLTGIKFFDFGQIPTGGGFTDMQIRFVPDYTIIPGIGIVFDPLEDSEWNSIRDEILAVENFDAHSRLVEQPHVKYTPLYLQIGNPNTETPIDLLTEPRFAGGSFNFTGAELENNAITLYTGFGNVGNEFLPIRLKDALGEYDVFNKFTSEPSFDADDVVYSVTNQDKIYLVPKFKSWDADLETQGVGTFDPEFNRYILNRMYRTQPNSVFLNPASPYFDYANVTALFALPDNPLPALFVEQYHQIVETMIADEDARAFRYFRPEGGGVLTASVIDAADFPNEEIEESNSFRVNNNVFAGFQYVDSPSGFLLAVIVRGSQKFYVWKI